MSVVIEHLNKVYPGGKHALRDVSFEIPSGMFGLLGPNGAGKSTLMKILVAQLKPSDGKVTICGYDLQTQMKEIRSILGYLPQDFRFFSKLRTYEFLDYAACVSGISDRRQRKEAVDAMLEQVGLFEVRERFAERLSGGMKRRLGIAQALIHKPKLIIVDEPTTGLDPEERIRFRNLLSTISGQDVTIILSTHIVGDISSTCSRMALLHQGQLAFLGSPEAMLQEVEGKVWLIKATQDEFTKINETFPVITTVPVASGWEMQIVADDPGSFRAEPYPPNLEHAYVYFMEHQLNHWSKA